MELAGESACFVGFGDSGGGVVDFKLLINLSYVKIDRFWAEIDSLPDFLLNQALRNKLEDFEFAFGKIEIVVMCFWIVMRIQKVTRYAGVQRGSAGQDVVDAAHDLLEGCFFQESGLQVQGAQFPLRVAMGGPLSAIRL